MADRKRRRHTEDERQDDRLRAVGLTEMEERILGRLARGMTRREICREQGIGHTMYDTCLKGARRYLGVRTTIEAVAIYVREKMRREEGEEEEDRENATAPSPG